MPRPLFWGPWPLIGIRPQPTVLEMALFKRQTTNYTIIDDQSPILLNSYVGNWTHLAIQGYWQNTATITATPGASLSFTFSGIQTAYARLRGAVLTLRWK
jgi:hypothetical protein